MNGTLCPPTIWQGDISALDADGLTEHFPAERAGSPMPNNLERPLCSAIESPPLHRDLELHHALPAEAYVVFYFTS